MADVAIEDGRIKILYGVENALPHVKKFMDNAKVKMDITFDLHVPSIVTKTPLYYEGYKDILKRGGKIRCITEINKDNKDYCKELLNIVSELRHLDGLKGGIAINESEYMATTVLKQEQPLTEVIYSNAKEVVSQNQYIFDTFWNNAIPAIKKIKEIEEGVEIEFVEVIDDALKARDIYFNILTSTRKELLLFIPSSIIPLIKNENKFFSVIKSLCKNDSIQINLLSNSKAEIDILSKQINKTIVSNESTSSNIKIRAFEKKEEEEEFKSLETIVIAIVDKKISIVIDLKSNNMNSFTNSIAFSICSNNKAIVSSYIYIFESLWKYINLFLQFKDINKKLKSQEIDLEKKIELKTHHLLKVNENLIKLNNEFKDKENTFKKTNEELLRIDRSKNEFISMISHELRTPLVPIKAYTEMLLKESSFGSINEKQKKALKSIYRNIKKQETLVEDILDYTKLEMGQFSLIKKDVSISDLFSNVVNDCKSMIGEKQISIITELNTKTINKIYCDEKRVEQVLLNLIKNSFDFVPQKDGKIMLMAELEQKEEEELNIVFEKDKNHIIKNIKNDSYIKFTIKDNGPGIPLDKIGNLFKKFYQMDTSATRKHTGTGLGLVICKGIVEAHGGRIWIDKNTFSTGVCIKFTIPIN